MRVKFICGCVSADIPERAQVALSPDVGFDQEGFLICRRHHQRRYGWRSVPYSGRNSSYAAWTELEYERWLLFMEPRISESLPVQLSGKDMRPYIYDDLLDPRGSTVVRKAISQSKLLTALFDIDDYK